MKIRLHNGVSGIALIMVLLVTVMLGILAAGFAFTMKVETKLARNASFDSEIEWVGRSGINMCRWMLSVEGVGPGGQIDCLNQRWAGGMRSNSPLPDIPKEIQLSDTCRFTWKIEAMDNKININSVPPNLLREILTQSIGIDDQWADTVVSSIQDWRDDNNDRTPNGAEGEDYSGSPNGGFPPYRAKNEDIHDISELLMVKGVTPELYWGSHLGEHWQVPKKRGAGRGGEEQTFEHGLVDIFTALSSGKLNLNTAPAHVWEALIFDPTVVQEFIIKRRAGPDGAEGTEDDTPFPSPSAFTLPGLNPQIKGAGTNNTVSQLQQIAGVSSHFFEVHIQARAGDRTREYVGILRRFSPRDIRLMNMYWK